MEPQEPKLQELKMPKLSEWECYLFGSKPGNVYGMIYQPVEGNVPNRFIRWMMRICLGCTWLKKQQKQVKTGQWKKLT